MRADAHISMVSRQVPLIARIDVPEPVVHPRFAALEDRLPEASVAAMIKDAHRA